ncbi:MAG: S41 family peptidase [Syntrophomonadaceae bacterium]|jgi:carboxyl-terminal processing protease|nr:S41 family peptidase [Syntrophomonadaceae bacterium]
MQRLIKGLSLFFAVVGLIATSAVLFILITNFSAVTTFFSVLGLVNTQSLYESDTNKLINGATSGMVESLDDPYSRYLDQQTWQDLQIKLEAKFGGIGVYVLQDDEGRHIIVSPIAGTPAYEAGVKNGDIIIRINGESIMNLSQDEVVHQMRGEPGTQLLLSVYRESDGQEHEFKIIREIINVPSVEAKNLDDVPGIGYIKLNQFHVLSAQEMADSVNKLLGENKIKGLILDLRNNGGGEFESSIAIASLFLNNGNKVVSVADNYGNETVHEASGQAVDIPLVVLVNGNSASASEILAGSLQDNKRAVLVGEKTFGKGLVQTIFQLPDGGALQLTTQKYFTPNGTDINKIGITPDYIVEMSMEDKEDLQLIKAIELIKKQIF